ncbi:hypothetical protein [Flavobacterium sp. LC2016-12]|uniref:hypothetical protein n=1 Tax=Flavobacterium sp. LC2016-12 TaxID=2783794 RepID=UPI00188D1300|nr:hypothetical protein [Flavobacterium sp. LC2016-12]MBF4465950.1 hypothetical protein [Flavobacterium sp. LC2016-12]
MDELLKLYTELLRVYTEQVQKLEALKTERSKEHRMEWVPQMALNSRIFTYDEYLQNSFHGGFCYEEKNLIMPHLVKFIANYDYSSDEVKKEFENQKPKNDYQRHLDDVLYKNILFIDFLKYQLRELQELQYTFKIPSQPSRKNATRQFAKYKTDRDEYFEKINGLNRCRDEVNERIKIVEGIKKEVEK